MKGLLVNNKSEKVKKKYWSGVGTSPNAQLYARKVFHTRREQL